jgi:hypothetical protein
MELVEIFGRLLLQLDVGIAVLRRHEAGMIRARRVGAEIAAAMGREDLQAGEAVQGPFEDQVLQGKGGIERVADGVRKPAIALEPLGEFRRSAGERTGRRRALALALRMRLAEKSSPNTLPPWRRRRPCFFTHPPAAARRDGILKGRRGEGGEVRLRDTAPPASFCTRRFARRHAVPAVQNGL